MQVAAATAIFTQGETSWLRGARGPHCPQDEAQTPRPGCRGPAAPSSDERLHGPLAPRPRALRPGYSGSHQLSRALGSEPPHVLFPLPEMLCCLQNSPRMSAPPGSPPGLSRHPGTGGVGGQSQAGQPDAARLPHLASSCTRAWMPGPPPGTWGPVQWRPWGPWAEPPPTGHRRGDAWGAARKQVTQAGGGPSSPLPCSPERRGTRGGLTLWAPGDSPRGQPFKRVGKKGHSCRKHSR